MREAVKNVAVLLGSTLAFLVVGEIGWRTHLYRSGRGFFDDPHEFTSPFFTTYAEPVPYVTHDRLYYLNEHVPRTKPSREVRVVCMGGSTTVNFRAGFSYPELLEKRLSDGSPGYGVRVLNAGSEGFSTAHVLVNLSLRNLDAQPDVVTLYENINDLSAVWFGDQVAPDYANKYLTDYYLAFRHRPGLLAGVAKISRLARFVFSRIDALEFPAARTRSGAPFQAGLEIFRRNLRSIVAVARANHVRVLLATQPARADPRADAGFVAYNKAIAQVAGEEAVPFVDLASQVTEGRFFFEDAIHNTPDGVRAVAEALAGPVLQLVREAARERGLS
jgi:lysophospholipase L1-like esterase